MSVIESMIEALDQRGEIESGTTIPVSEIVRDK